jgi:hypothetical protein
MCELTAKQCKNAGTDKCKLCNESLDTYFEFSDYNDIRCASFDNSDNGNPGKCAWIEESIRDKTDLPSNICKECCHYYFTRIVL